MSDSGSTMPALRWWQYIGPWPIRPVPVTIFATLFFAFTAAASAVLEVQLVAHVSFAAQTLSVITAGAVLWALLCLGQRWALRHPLGLTGYLFVFAVAAIAGVLVRSFIGGVSDLLLDSPASFITTVVRVGVPVVAVNSIIGVTTARLIAQVEQTQAALALTRIQQDWMLSADEQARRQVAETLHDRVQATLIAACLQLQATDPSDRAGIDAVIGRLEELRKVDVRRAARALSPTLSEVGLASSLSELGAQYEPGMVTLVRVGQDVEGGPGRVGERTRLGCYRIVEQALLNSAIHGRATTCTVDIRLEGDELLITVDDDGRGLGAQVPEAGSGSALMSTWARTLGGEWEWGPRPGGGVSVRVRVLSSQV